jgi:sterol desaturase/sphingolipid hydroxylase (fatty acid hydroxylase superfamily)
VNKPNIAGRNIPDHLKPNPGATVMFSNGLLERLSKISPIIVLGIYIPLSGYALWLASAVSDPAEIIGLVFFGFLFWTLFEYVFHRSVFHFWPKGKFQSWLQFTIHGVHHQYPHDKDRLVMPVTISLLIAGLLFWLFYATLGQPAYAFTAGFMLGYLFYDMMHYSIHNFDTPNNKLGQLIWRHHLAHHFLDTGNGYGVSTPVWDYVFGTTILNRSKANTNEPEKLE